MRFTRQRSGAGVHELVVVEQRQYEGIGPHGGQRPVVPAAALPEPHPRVVDRERRHDDDLGVCHGVRAEVGARRLERTPGGAGLKIREPDVLGPAAPQAAPEHRQQDPNPSRLQPLQQRTGSWFGRPGGVQRDAARLHHLVDPEHHIGQGRRRVQSPVLGPALANGSAGRAQAVLRGDCFVARAQQVLAGVDHDHSLANARSSTHSWHARDTCAR